MRHRTGEERRTPPARFAPLSFEHPLVGEPCGECGEPLRSGQRPALMAVGPDDLNSASKADQGGWYRALALPMHESCAWPESS